MSNEIDERPQDAQQMKMELLDMIHSGENPFDIIYKVAVRLEAASSEPGYSEYVRDQLRSIYGFALQDKKLMTDELEDVEKRLERIEKARENPEFTEEEKIRIGFAIERHKKNIERLKLLIQQAEANHKPLYLVK